MFWDVCSCEVVRCVVNLSEELAALSLMSRARLPRLHRQASRLLYVWFGQKGLI